MYNENEYNLKPYNIEWGWVSLTSQDDIVFNGLSLQNENFTITNSSFDNSHLIENEIFNRPLTDWVWELNFFFREKIIKFSWKISTENAEELNNEIDRIKKIVLQNSKNLDIKVNWVIRRWNATCINAEELFFREFYNVTFINIELQFRVTEFFKEIIRQNITLSWQTAWFIEEIYNDWSAKANPLVTITFNSVTSVDEIIFTNWWDTITIDETIINWNILQIDVEEKQVLINDVEVDYSWTFPRLDPWVNSYQIEINWTKNFDFNLSYFNTYL